MPGNNNKTDSSSELAPAEPGCVPARSGTDPEKPDDDFGCNCCGNRINRTRYHTSALDDYNLCESCFDNRDNIAVGHAFTSCDANTGNDTTLMLSRKLKQGLCCGHMTVDLLNKRIAKHTKSFGDQAKDADPAEVEHHIEHLLLASNKLDCVPDSVMEMSWLHTLTLSNNDLSTSPSLALLSNLRCLQMDNNMLEDLGDLPGKLVRLDISHNKLSGPLPVALGQLKSLSSLIVSHNSLSSIAAAAHLPNLKLLDVSHNDITKLPRFKESPDLRVLNCSSNCISVVEDFSLGVSLVELHLEDNNLMALPQSLLSSQRLCLLRVDPWCKLPTGLEATKMLTLYAGCIESALGIPNHMVTLPETSWAAFESVFDKHFEGQNLPGDAIQNSHVVQLFSWMQSSFRLFLQAEQQGLFAGVPEIAAQCARVRQDPLASKWFTFEDEWQGVGALFSKLEGNDMDTWTHGRGLFVELCISLTWSSITVGDYVRSLPSDKNIKKQTQTKEKQEESMSTDVSNFAGSREARAALKMYKHAYYPAAAFVDTKKKEKRQTVSTADVNHFAILMFLWCSILIPHLVQPVECPDWWFLSLWMGSLACLLAVLIIAGLHIILGCFCIGTRCHTLQKCALSVMRHQCLKFAAVIVALGFGVVFLMEATDQGDVCQNTQDNAHVLFVFIAVLLLLYICESVNSCRRSRTPYVDLKYLTRSLPDDVAILMSSAVVDSDAAVQDDAISSIDLTPRQASKYGDIDTVLAGTEALTATLLVNVCLNADITSLKALCHRHKALVKDLIYTVDVLTGLDPLHACARHDFVDGIVLILSLTKAELLVALHGDTIVHTACRHNSYKVVKWLLTQPEFRSEFERSTEAEGFNAIHCCVITDSWRALKALKRCSYPVPETTKALISQIVLRTDRDGRTPLHLAVSVCNVDAIVMISQWMPEAGLQISEKDGLTPAELALKLGHQNASSYILACQNQWYRRMFEWWPETCALNVTCTPLILQAAFAACALIIASHLGKLDQDHSIDAHADAGHLLHYGNESHLPFGCNRSLTNAKLYDNILSPTWCSGSCHKCANKMTLNVSQDECQTVCQQDDVIVTNAALAEWFWVHGVGTFAFTCITGAFRFFHCYFSPVDLAQATFKSGSIIWSENVSILNKRLKWFVVVCVMYQGCFVLVWVMWCIILMLPRRYNQNSDFVLKDAEKVWDGRLSPNNFAPDGSKILLPLSCSRNFLGRKPLVHCSQLHSVAPAPSRMTWVAATRALAVLSCLTAPSVALDVNVVVMVDSDLFWHPTPVEKSRHVSRVSSAMDLAQQDFASVTGLTGVALNIVGNDVNIGCDKVNGVGLVSEYINSSTPITAIIGAMCSTVSLAVVDMSTYHKIPMLSYGSVDPKLGSSSDFPYFFRTFLSTNEFWDKYSLLAAILKLKAVVTLTSPFFKEQSDGMEERLQLIGATVLDTIVTLPAFCPPEGCGAIEDAAVDFSLEQIRDTPAQVIVPWCYEGIGKYVLAKCADYNICGKSGDGGYVWFLSVNYFDGWTSFKTSDEPYVPPENLVGVFVSVGGWAGAFAPETDANGLYARYYSRMASHETANGRQYTVPSPGSFDYFYDGSDGGFQVYNSIMAVAWALRKMQLGGSSLPALSDFNIRLGVAAALRTGEVGFNGINGHVRFNSSSNEMTDAANMVSILNFKDDGKFHQLPDFNSSAAALNFKFVFSGGKASPRKYLGCPAGKYTSQSAGGQITCEECSPNNFNENLNASICQPCALNSMALGKGTKSELDCLCQYGYYRPNATQATCLPCPDEANNICRGGNHSPVCTAGFFVDWSPGFNASSYKCAFAGACQGPSKSALDISALFVLTNDTDPCFCAVGHKGVMCDACQTASEAVEEHGGNASSHGFFKSVSGACLPCEFSPEIVVTITISFVLAISFFFYILSKMVADLSSGTSFMILLKFAMLLYVVLQTHFEWPAYFLVFKSVLLELASFDVLSWFPTACLVPHGVDDVLHRHIFSHAIAVCWPLIFISFVRVIFVLICLRKYGLIKTYDFVACCKRKVSPDCDDNHPSEMRLMWEKHNRMCVIFLNSIHASLAVHFLSFFECRFYAKTSDWRQIKDTSVQCWSANSVWLYGSIWNICGIVIWVLGIPFLNLRRALRLSEKCEVLKPKLQSYFRDKQLDEKHIEKEVEDMIGKMSEKLNEESEAAEQDSHISKVNLLMFFENQFYGRDWQAHHVVDTLIPGGQHQTMSKAKLISLLMPSTGRVDQRHGCMATFLAIESLLMPSTGSYLHTYRKGMAAWEALLLMQPVILMSSLILCTRSSTPNDTFEGPIMIACMLVFITAQVYVRPFKKDGDNNSQGCCLVCVAVCLATGSSMDGAHKGSLEHTLFFALGVVMVLTAPLSVVAWHVTDVVDSTKKHVVSRVASILAHLPVFDNISAHTLDELALVFEPIKLDSAQREEQEHLDFESTLDSEPHGRMVIILSGELTIEQTGFDKIIAFATPRNPVSLGWSHLQSGDELKTDRVQAQTKSPSIALSLSSQKAACVLSKFGKNLIDLNCTDQKEREHIEKMSLLFDHDDPSRNVVYIKPTGNGGFSVALVPADDWQRFAGHDLSDVSLESLCWHKIQLRCGCNECEQVADDTEIIDSNHCNPPRTHGLWLYKVASAGPHTKHVKLESLGCCKIEDEGGQELEQLWFANPVAGQGLENQQQKLSLKLTSEDHDLRSQLFGELKLAYESEATVSCRSIYQTALKLVLLTCLCLHIILPAIRDLPSMTKPTESVIQMALLCVLCGCSVLLALGDDEYKPTDLHLTVTLFPNPGAFLFLISFARVLIFAFGVTYVESLSSNASFLELESLPATLDACTLWVFVILLLLCDLSKKTDRHARTILAFFFVLATFFRASSQQLGSSNGAVRQSRSNGDVSAFNFACLAACFQIGRDGLWVAFGDPLSLCLAFVSRPCRDKYMYFSKHGTPNDDSRCRCCGCFGAKVQLESDGGVSNNWTGNWMSVRLMVLECGIVVACVLIGMAASEETSFAIMNSAFGTEDTVVPLYMIAACLLAVCTVAIMWHNTVLEVLNSLWDAADPWTIVFVGGLDWFILLFYPSQNRQASAWSSVCVLISCLLCVVLDVTHRQTRIFKLFWHFVLAVAHCAAAFTFLHQDTFQRLYPNENHMEVVKVLGIVFPTKYELLATSSLTMALLTTSAFFKDCCRNPNGRLMSFVYLKQYRWNVQGGLTQSQVASRELVRARRKSILFGPSNPGVVGDQGQSE